MGPCSGRLLVPSHLVQDPSSYTGVGLFRGVGRNASQHVADFTSAWVNLRYYWNGT